MAYDTKLADRIRAYLMQFPRLSVDEKKMFNGLTFMVNGKMCISVSGGHLLCRFDPDLQEDIAEQNGFQPMVMKGKELKGYCYVHPVGFGPDKYFAYWVDLCLNYNEKAKSSKKAR